MKSMVLTGLGSEQDFETGGTGYFLIFNSGGLRVPISEKAAETVIKEMYGGEVAATEIGQEPPVAQREAHGANSNDDEFDDGVGQI